jgi:hypothetical protein
VREGREGREGERERRGGTPMESESKSESERVRVRMRESKIEKGTDRSLYPAHVGPLLDPVLCISVVPPDDQDLYSTDCIYPPPYPRARTPAHFMQN